MLKIIGLIMLFCSCTVMGIYIAITKRKALAVHSENYEMLCELKSILRFNQPNKTELYASLRKLGYGSCLDNMNDSILRDYFSRLGTRDLKSELEAIEQCIERYRLSLRRMEENTDNVCKLSIGAGVLIGTFLVVMLV